jgi:hypothetical protein
MLIFRFKGLIGFIFQAKLIIFDFSHSLTYTGNPGSYIRIELLKCLLICETLETLEPQAPVGEYGSGSYLWNINPPIGVDYLPGIPYRIRITTSDSSATDTSKGFTFNDQPISLPGIITDIRVYPAVPLYGQEVTFLGLGPDYTIKELPQYIVTLTIVNPNSVPVLYDVGLKNDGFTTCNPGADYHNVKQDPGFKYTYNFICKTEWNWIPHSSSAWWELGKRAAEKGIFIGLDKVSPVVEVVPVVSAFYAIYKTIDLSYNIVPSKPYNVELSSTSSTGLAFDPSINRQVTVKVPDEKKEFLVSSVVHSMASSGLTMFAVVSGLTTGGLSAGLSTVFAIGELLDLGVSWSYYEQAYDPDFNYTTVQAPIPMHLPELDAVPDGDAKNLALAYADIASLRNATFTAYVRADGARIDNQSDYMLMQLEAANNFTLQGIQKMSEVTKYYKLTTASMEPLTDGQIQQARAKLQTDGLPQAEIDILTRNGLGDGIENITQMVLDTSPEVYRNPKNYTRFMDIEAAFLAYESTEYMSEIVRIKVEEKGMSNTTASEADIAYLEDLKSQINLSINQGIGTHDAKAQINEMINKSREVLDETNNLTYQPYYEFAVNALAIFQTLDITSPTSALSLTGTSGSIGWYISNVQVNLTATDNENGSGINITEYRFDNATWISYTVPFNVTNEGTTTLYYRSIDNAGNVETTRNQTIEIDKTQPVLNSVTLNNSTPNTNDAILVTVNATDNIGVTSVVANGASLTQSRRKYLEWNHYCIGWNSFSECLCQ